MTHGSHDKEWVQTTFPSRWNSQREFQAFQAFFNYMNETIDISVLGKKTCWDSYEKYVQKHCIFSTKNLSNVVIAVGNNMVVKQIMKPRDDWQRAVGILICAAR